MMTRTALCFALYATVASAQDRTMSPESERQVARATYKEMVEIKSGADAPSGGRTASSCTTGREID